MQKDFITATPDSGGSGSTTVTATAPANQTESARSTSLSVAGGGMTRTVGASQAARVVTWNYYFSVTPTSLSFVAGGETKAVTVTSYRKKVINGVETSTQENVNWTPTVSGTGFSVSGSNVTAETNSATTTRSGTATYTQTGSGKTQAVSLSQEAVPSVGTSVRYSSSGSVWGTLYIYTGVDDYSVNVNQSVNVQIDLSDNSFRTNNDYSSGSIESFTLTLSNCQISNVNNITTENCSMQIVQSGSNVEIRITNVDTNDDSLQYNAYGYGTLTIDGKTLSDIRFIIEGSHY